MSKNVMIEYFQNIDSFNSSQVIVSLWGFFFLFICCSQYEYSRWRACIRCILLISTYLACLLPWGFSASSYLCDKFNNSVSEQQIDSSWFQYTLNNVKVNFVKLFVRVFREASLYHVLFFYFRFFFPMPLLLIYSFMLYMFLCFFHLSHWIIWIESLYMFDRSWRIFLPLWATLVGGHDNKWVIVLFSHLCDQWRSIIVCFFSEDCSFYLYIWNVLKVIFLLL